MNFKEKILKLLNKIYRLDELVNILLNPIASKVWYFLQIIESVYKNFFFDTLDEYGCNYYEKILGLTTNETEPLDNRRAKIQAKWLSNNHNSITLIRNICSSWNDGETEADFKNGKITLRFTRTIGTPANLESLLKAIEIIKPAHIPILTIFRYLIIEEIHEVKSIEEMERPNIDMFEF